MKNIKARKSHATVPLKTAKYNLWDLILIYKPYVRCISAVVVDVGPDSKMETKDPIVQNKGSVYCLAKSKEVNCYHQKALFRDCVAKNII